MAATLFRWISSCARSAPNCCHRTQWPTRRRSIVGNENTFELSVERGPVVVAQGLDEVDATAAFEARVDVALGVNAYAVAGGTKWSGDGGDEADHDFVSAIVETVPPGGVAAVGRSHVGEGLRQHFNGLLTWQKLIGKNLCGDANGHQFDEPHLTVELLSPTHQVNEVFGVDGAQQHGVDLESTKSSLACGFDAREDFTHGVLPCQGCES